MPALALATLTGCRLGPEYSRPELDVPPAFVATAASATQAWPAVDWWRGFGSPDLDALIAEAKVNNQDLAAAAARVLQADAQVSIAGAPLLPSLSGVGQQQYQRTGSAGRSRSGGFSFSSNGSIVSSSGGSHYTDSRSYSAELQASYEIDFWGKNRATADAAISSALASRFDQETVALTVVTSIATTYFSALSFEDRLAVARRNLADQEQILQAIRGRFSVGTANALDVAQQEALVSGTRANIPNLQSQMEQQVIALGILVGRPPESITIRPGTLLALSLPPVTPGLPSELLARRPDVANAEALLISENGNVRAARAAFYPSIQLTASGGVSSAALTAITGPGSLIAALGTSITQTIFDNGLKQGNLDVAKGRFAELAANYRKAVLQAFTDVETALVALRYTTEQEALEQQAVTVAQRASDIARAQLAAGTIDIVTALNTQTTLFNDQDTLAQVRLARFQALVSLYKALGGGWSVPALGGPT